MTVHMARLPARYGRMLVDRLDRLVRDLLLYTPDWAETDDEGELVIEVRREPVKEREA